jgi:hypothetical protein
VSSGSTSAPSPGRSSACADDAHQACGHVGFASRPGAGRLGEPTVILCRCPCHKKCPLGRGKPGVPVTVWRRRCVCPGAEDARATHGDPCELLPEFEDYWPTYEQESRDRSAAREEAATAARAAAPGKTRDEVRQLYVSELESRGLETPPDWLLEVAVDIISGDPRTGLGKLWKTAFRTFAKG